MTFLFTDVSKNTIGRLRPHFLNVCRPDYNQADLCKDEYGYQKFVTLEDDVEVCRSLVDNVDNETETYIVTKVCANNVEICRTLL